MSSNEDLQITLFASEPLTIILDPGSLTLDQAKDMRLVQTRQADLLESLLYYALDPVSYYYLSEKINRRLMHGKVTRLLADNEDGDPVAMMFYPDGDTEVQTLSQNPESTEGYEELLSPADYEE